MPVRSFLREFMLWKEDRKENPPTVKQFFINEEV